MDRNAIIKIMEVLGFYESFNCRFTTEPKDGLFISLIPLSYQDRHIASPLEAVAFEVCDASTGRSLQRSTFINLEHMLRVKIPDKVSTFKRVYDPLEGLNIPLLGKKKAKKKKDPELKTRDIFKQVIRLVAAMPARPTFAHN